MMTLLATLAVVAAAVSPGSAVAAPSSFYLAIGDSVTVATGPTSYPHLLLGHYHPAVPGLVLDDIGVGGATTGSALSAGQYATALRFLHSHRGHVALITVDLGGDDYVPCYTSTGVNSACTAQALVTIRRNLGTILAGLRRAAPGVPLIGMNYYNPFDAYWLSGGVFGPFALSTIPPLLALNGELDAIYGATRTADVQDAFSATDMTTIVSSPWGEVPIGVDRACTWLNLQCEPGSLAWFGIDPNAAGEAIIAQAFEHTIGTLCAPGRSLVRGRCRLARR